MSNVDPDSQSSELQPTQIVNGSGAGRPETEPTEVPSPLSCDGDLNADTRISPDADEEHRFSPSDDTFSAIQDLGLRLQAVPDHRVIGRMAHYDIIRCLGRGGMGTVFEAFDTKLFRPVAIKFMASSLAASPKARSRFLREARVAASINHPNVVTIHSVDEYDGRPYLVMEFVSGSTLHDHLRKLGPLPIGDVLRISRQIATGLRAAHEKGIVHRDIKPGNILLENGIQRVKIVDFGLAQVVFELSDITSQGQTLGTPRYMAPEQIEGSRVDERADLFSLGCVIYLMCVGQPPFPGNSITVLHKILRDAHVPMRQVLPEIPPTLSDMVDSLLSKTREQRIQTAARVEEILTEIARGGTPSDEYLRAIKPQAEKASPAPTPARRGPGKIGAAVAAVGVLAIIGWSAFGPDRTRENIPTEAPQTNDSQKDVTATEAATELKARQPTTLTVGGAEADFSSLQAALLETIPGDTLTVLGQLPSDDVVLLNDPARHSNLTIDWKTDTTLDWSGSASSVIKIESVQGIQIRGARIRATNAHLLSVRGDCTGLVVENCRLEQAPGSHQAAVVFWSTAKGTEASPIQLQHSEIIFFEQGIGLIGAENSPVQFVELKDNVIRGLQSEWGVALMLEKFVSQIHVQHNRITNVRAGVNITGTWNQVQITNNTFFDVISCLGGVQDPTTQSILIVANLAIQCDAFAAGLSPAAGGISFAFNKSDSPNAMPELAAEVREIAFVSTDSSSPEFMMPLADNQLKVPAIPDYAGALEPRK